MKKMLLAICLLIVTRMANSQNVGIGINVPVVPLHLYRNTDEMLRLQGANPYISFYSFNGVAQGYLQGHGADLLMGTHFGNTSGAIKIYNNNVLNMSILPNGNVGIGTGTPGAPLSFPNVLGKKISFWSSGPNNDFGIGIQSGRMQFYTAGQDLISFGWGSSSAYVETMRYATGSGQLMIGTSTAAGRLHIVKDAEAIRLTGNGTYLSLYNGGIYKGYLWSKEPNDLELGTSPDNTGGNLNLRVHGAEGMTVMNDGRIRVGALACNMSVDVNGSGLQLPKLSVHGPLGLKKSWGDQVGEWTLFYSSQNYGANHYSDVLTFFFNGGRKSSIDDADGTYYSVSDKRLKENFEYYKPVLAGIKKLDVQTYHFRSDNKERRSFGLVAQNLKEYFPELVMGDGNESYLSIAYGKTGVLAIKAIQEQQEIIDAQQKKIDLLEKRLEKLEARQR